MKWRLAILGVTVVFASLGGAAFSQTSARRITVKPADTGVALENPGMG